MPIITIGIDLAKNIFAVHGVNENGHAKLVKPSVSQAPVADVYRGLGSTGLAVWIVGTAVKNPSFNSTQEITLPA